MTNKLKLRGESQEDVTVLSSALQDAILRVGEISYNSVSRSLSFRVSRFNHESKAPARTLTGLRIDGILDLKSRGIDRSNPKAYLVLMALTFTPDKDGPGGLLNLVFSGDGVLQARVEAIDIILADTDETRKTDKMPVHPTDTE